MVIQSPMRILQIEERRYERDLIQAGVQKPYGVVPGKRTATSVILSARVVSGSELVLEVIALDLSLASHPP